MEIAELQTTVDKLPETMEAIRTAPDEIKKGFQTVIAVQIAASLLLITVVLLTRGKKA